MASAILATEFIKVEGNQIKIEVIAKLQRNNTVKNFVIVNGETWHSINPYNFKHYQKDEMDKIKYDLESGSYKMFLN